VSPEHLDAKARRVVVGVNEHGKSTVMKDEFTATRIALPAFTLNDVWRLDHVPARLDDDTLTGKVELAPPAAGIVVRLVTFPPDSDVDPAAYGESIDTLFGPDFNAGHEQAMGVHFSDTVDVNTILSGELYCVLESGEEILLRPGDTIINRGTKHAWSNRGDKPVTLVATVVPAKR
jgi:mannose-6-phosphate isomerase-like protein (cupin superfamily)